MKRLGTIRQDIYFINKSVLIILGIFCLILSSLSFINTSEAAIPQQNISINLKTKKVSVVLKGVETKKALEEIARQTGIQFVGLDDVSGVIEDLEFIDRPLEEAIKTIGQDNILIFRKEGPEKGEKEIKKVIILVQKEKREPPARPVPPPKPPTPPPPPMPKPLPPPPPPPKPPTPPPVIPKRIEREEPPKPAPKPVEPLPVERQRPEPVPPRPKPAQKPLKITPVSTEECLALGQKYYDAKRWDLAAKNLRCYLSKNPNDQDVKDKIEEAVKFAQEAIDIYRAARNEEESCNIKSALELYKKSYKLYPLLYDTWERMRDLKKKSQCD